MLLRWIESGGIALVFLGVAVEIFIPLIRGTPLFPIFSGARTRKLARDLAKANQEVDEAALRGEIESRRPHQDATNQTKGA